jgi:hypothetical protein
MTRRDTPTKGNLFCDERFYGVKRWYSSKPKDANMRVPDDITKCVCFLAVREENAYGTGEDDVFIGTAFFMQTSEEGGHFRYLVTAKHIIDEAKEKGYTEIYARVNTAAGGSEMILLRDEWIPSENPAIDAVALSFNPTIIVFDYFPLITGLCVNDDNIYKAGIGIGDELLITGLFNRKHGYRKNMPIVRSGSIAAMPDRREPFVTESGETYEAYLVEMRSISGLSGSPVFVLTETSRPPQGRHGEAFYFKTLLLGMIRGHWDLRKQDAVSDSLQHKIDSDEIDRLNAGIAVVTPIKDIIDILDGDTFMRQREQRQAQKRKANEPTLDSNMPKKQSKDEDISRKEFEDALKKASRKTSEPES